MMMALTMMAKAVMIKGMTQAGHPQAGHLNRLNLRLKGDNPDADHRHHLEHNSNSNSHSSHLQMTSSHSIRVTIQERHLRQVQAHDLSIHDLITLEPHNLYINKNRNDL